MAVTPLIYVTDIPSDLSCKVSGITLNLMISGASAAAYRVAPCLKDNPTEEQVTEAKLVVLSAVARWLSDGSGMAGTSLTAGPFTQSTTPPPVRASGYRLWPSEIADLQAICRSGSGLTSIELGSSQGARRQFCDDFDAGPPS